MRQESKSQCQLAKTKNKDITKSTTLSKEEEEKIKKDFEKMKKKEKKARVLIEYVENKS